MSLKKKEIFLIIIVVIVFVTLPFFLNWILQKEAVVQVIGDSVTWLSFWGTYIGAVLTAVMVLVAFISIRKTANINRTQWKMAWLSSFRSAAADMISSVDATAVGQMAQDISFWRFDQAVERGHAMEKTVNRSAFLLTSLLKEYDELFHTRQSIKYIKELNSFIRPFLQTTGEIIQFAILCKFLKEKTGSGERANGVKVLYEMTDTMASMKYLVIKEALQCLKDGDSTIDVVHNAVVKMQKNLESVDINGLEKLLLRISAQNAKLTYDVSNTDFSSKG